jgi:hypothetical protein
MVSNGSPISGSSLYCRVGILYLLYPSILISSLISDLPSSRCILYSNRQPCNAGRQISRVSRILGNLEGPWSFEIRPRVKWEVGEVPTKSSLLSRAVHVCMCVCVHVCMCACVHVCMCACVYVCMCACVHVCMCACWHVHSCSWLN